MSLRRLCFLGGAPDKSFMKTPTESVVLIVDDDENVRDAIALIVAKRGYQILGATSGWEAIDILQEQPVDVVISDIHMDKGDGLELLEYLNMNSDMKPEVIMVTGNLMYTEENVALLGARTCLHKPFYGPTLVAEVDRAIGYQRTAA